MSWINLSKEQRDWIYALMMCMSELDENTEEDEKMLTSIKEDLRK